MARKGTAKKTFSSFAACLLSLLARRVISASCESSTPLCESSGVSEILRREERERRKTEAKVAWIGYD